MRGNKVTIGVKMKVNPSSANPSRGSSSGRKVFLVTVNYDLTLVQMIAAGNFDSDYLSERSRVIPKWSNRGNSRIEIELFDISRYLGFDQALVTFDDEGFRPATLPELLAFCADYPVEQRRTRLFALGTSWKTDYDFFTIQAGSDSHSGRYIQILDVGNLGEGRGLIIRKGSGARRL